MSDEVRAAGGLVVRDGRVLLTHRPRYDDWSLPKGKLDPGETWEQAALREVEEETGVRAALGEELPPARYADQGGRLKTVRYWRMEPAEDRGFEPNEEVDEIAWLEPGEAAARATYPHDRELIASLARNAGAEVERKFLVERPPDGLDPAAGVPIRQGYLTTGDVEVRLRRAGDRTLLTIKAGRGLVRAEEELAIDPDRFARLWPLTEGRRVEKVRHRLPADGVTIELDVYAGAREGLLVAEVEFASEEAATRWEPPAWLGREVTGDPAYANARLAS